MNKAVQVSSRLFYRLPHLIIAVQVENVGDEIQSILVILDLSVQARQVEAIREVVLVDLAEVLIAAGGYELMICR
jgi:hypothetical protein